MKGEFIITLIIIAWLLCGCAGGYGVAHLSEDYDGFGFETDIVYAEGILMLDTPVPFCPQAELGSIAEQSIGGDDVTRYEVNIGCSFGLFGT